jgi:hypothetical protein
MPPLMYGAIVIVGLVGVLLGALFRRVQSFVLRGYAAPG